MLKRHALICVLALVFLAVGTTGAREVVEFADGRYLEIARHESIEDFVRLELNPGSYLVIPAGKIDKIRHGRETVFDSSRLTDTKPRHELRPDPSETTVVVESGRTVPTAGRGTS